MYIIILHKIDAPVLLRQSLSCWLWGSKWSWWQGTEDNLQLTANKKLKPSVYQSTRMSAANEHITLGEVTSPSSLIWDCSPRPYQLQALRPKGILVRNFELWWNTRWKKRNWELGHQSPSSRTFLFYPNVFLCAYNNINAACKLPVPRKGFVLCRRVSMQVLVWVCVHVCLLCFVRMIYTLVSPFIKHKSLFPVQSNLAVMSIKGNHFIWGNRGLFSY